MSTVTPFLGWWSGGFGAMAEPTAPTTTRPPIALYYDPKTRDFRRTDGLYDELHPVDQAVALAVFTELGAIPAVPDLGSTVRSVPYAGGPTVVNDVKNRVRLAIQTLVNAGDVTEESITVEVKPSLSRIAVTLQYFNNRTRQRVSLPVQV